MAHTSPLFECDRCPLAHSVSTARTQAEDRIIHDMHIAGHKQLVYVGYASGGLGFDVRLLQRLITGQYNTVTIIFIDHEYHAVLPLCNHKHSISAHTDKPQTAVTSHAQAIQQRCQYAEQIIRQHAHAHNVHVTIHWFSTAEQYYHMVQQNPNLKADITTWIDPDIPVTPDAPYTNTDAAFLDQCHRDRSYHYILTIDTDHVPQLIRTVYNTPLTQQTVWNMSTNTQERALYIASHRVYPHDPIQGAILLNDTIYTPASHLSQAVMLLHDMVTGNWVHTHCILPYVHNQLMELVACSAPG